MSICKTCGQEIIEETTSEILITRFPDGQYKEWTETIKDSKGAVISSRVAKYSYFDSGEIDEIEQTEFDADGNKTKSKKIKHFKDGRQPEII